MQQHMINQARMSMRLVFAKMVVVIKMVVLMMKMIMIYLVASMFGRSVVNASKFSRTKSPK